MKSEETQYVARVCWNSNGWTRPSGPDGKSRGSGSYERHTGYGHEEWLLDLTKLVRGYHYGFIQALSHNRARLLKTAKPFHVHLFSVDAARSTWWWLGKIKHVEMVDAAESKTVFASYKKSGWYAEMKDQLKSVGADVGEFTQNVPADIFTCMKFLPENLELLPQPVAFMPDDRIVSASYYSTLFNFKNLPRAVKPSGFAFKPGLLSSGEKEPSSNVVVSYTQTKTREEAQLCARLAARLRKRHGAKNVAQEQPTALGTRIDLVVKAGEQFDLYEVKIASSARVAVRLAIGQLLEYGFFGGGVPQVRKLVVVSTAELDSSARVYLEALRARFELPIEYEQCPAP